MGEAGMEDFVVEQWQAVFALAGTPAPVSARLHREIYTALQHTDIMALGEKLGVTPGQLGALQKSDCINVARVIGKGAIMADRARVGTNHSIRRQAS